MGIKSYVLPNSTKEMEYEIVERINKEEKNGQQQDGVNSLPIVVSKTTKERFILVIKNYRPPIDKYCIEFPGGLIDENESVEDAALRELEEETGYSGRVLKEYSSPLLPVCAGTGSESTSIVPILIDYDQYKDRGNIKTQNLDEDEVIEPVLIPYSSFSDSIHAFYDNGFAIELQVYYYALSFYLNDVKHFLG